jgi:hypothetical protein
VRGGTGNCRESGCCERSTSAILHRITGPQPVPRAKGRRARKSTPSSPSPVAPPDVAAAKSGVAGHAATDATPPTAVSDAPTSSPAAGQPAARAALGPRRRLLAGGFLAVVVVVVALFALSGQGGAGPGATGSSGPSQPIAVGSPTASEQRFVGDVLPLGSRSISSARLRHTRARSAPRSRHDDCPAAWLPARQHRARHGPANYDAYLHGVLDAFAAEPGHTRADGIALLRRASANMHDAGVVARAKALQPLLDIGPADLATGTATLIDSFLAGQSPTSSRLTPIILADVLGGAKPWLVPAWIQPRQVLGAAAA